MSSLESIRSMKTPCRPCPVCGAVQVEILRHQPFVLPEGHLLPSAFDVVCCEGCGFCYADTPAGQADYDRYYAEFSKYADDRTSTGGGGSVEDARRLQEFAAQLAATLHDHPQASVLDIGCSNGGLLQALQTSGFQDLTGVDPSPVCVANALSRPGLRAHVGTLTNLPDTLGQYDLVVLSHVLEHVMDLGRIIAPLARLLTVEGRLYVEVPDAMRYTDFVTAPFQDFNVEHINHFDLAALERLFAAHGFVLEASGQKDLPTAQGLSYPAVYVYFRAGTSADERPLPFNSALRGALVAYIAKSQQLMDLIEEKVAPLATPGAGPIIVWGTGQLAMKLLGETSLRHAKIAAFVDGNPVNQGKMLRGAPILAPSQVAHLPLYPVLISTQLHQQAILGVLRNELSLTNSTILL